MVPMNAGWYVSVKRSETVPMHCQAISRQRTSGGVPALVVQPLPLRRNCDRAGIGQWEDEPPEWRQGAKGYAYQRTLPAAEDQVRAQQQEEPRAIEDTKMAI